MNDRGSNWGFGNWSPGRFPMGNRGGRGRGNFRGRRNFRGPQNYGNFGGYRGGNRPQGNFDDRNTNHSSRPKDRPGKRLSEVEIGVTEYISNHSGFEGIIKMRYSDFQVSEINEKGEIAKLTDMSAPPAPADEAVDEDEDLLINKYNLELLPLETWDGINKLAISQASTERIDVDVSDMSKEHRTKIHVAVKKAFGETIVSSTVNETEKKLVRFERWRKGVRVDNRVKWAWPGEYVHFIVHKENCDTMEAAATIAERLRINIKPSMLGYAGTKDRRAKTSQWFSLRKVDPRRLAAVGRSLRCIALGNYAFSATNLRLGMLRGNRFRIALRHVTAPDEQVFAACELLKERGFLNYYGLQRFGTRADCPTYRVGRQLLQGKLKEAISSILEVREGYLHAPLDVYAREGAEAALRAWPRRSPHTAIEWRLLRALARCPTDLQGALDQMARNSRLLYLHSYQSLIWNRAVSERVRRAGLTPAVGDLVPLTRVDEDEELREEASDSEDAETDSEKQDGADELQQDGASENKMADDAKQETALNAALETSIIEKQKVPVKVLTQEDVDSGKYSIFDIVLPLPGYMVEYPPNMKAYYEEQLAKDGLQLEMKHKLKSYSLSGAYRHVCVRPLDVSWHCARYTEPLADLLRSDRDEMEGKEITAILEDGKYKALFLNMTLPASCYATMALRELLRADTSGDNQAVMTHYNRESKVKSEETQQKDEETQNKDDETPNKDDETPNKGEETSKHEKSQNGDEIEMKIVETADKRKLESDSEDVGVKKLKQEDGK